MYNRPIICRIQVTMWNEDSPYEFDNVISSYNSFLNTYGDFLFFGDDVAHLIFCTTAKI